MTDAVTVQNSAEMVERPKNSYKVDISSGIA